MSKIARIKRTINPIANQIKVSANATGIKSAVTARTAIAQIINVKIILVQPSFHCICQLHF